MLTGVGCCNLGFYHNKGKESPILSRKLLRLCHRKWEKKREVEETIEKPSRVQICHRKLQQRIEVRNVERVQICRRSASLWRR
uniref:Uncharacterized protein n=1 Tax=Nelumbo nucifera TaxID=4432 RepID=A0A822YIV6_NELNU|nr:TPA_asm: hypothetical protein HUJ06_030796 [Nelumbo nucifera]